MCRSGASVRERCHRAICSCSPIAPDNPTELQEAATEGETPPGSGRPQLERAGRSA